MDGIAPPGAQADNGLESLGSTLRSRRKELGYTLVDVAERAKLSPGFISQVERTLVSPSLSSLAAISRVLQSNISDLLVVRQDGSVLTRPSDQSAYSEKDKTLSYERISTSFPGHILNGVIMHSGPGRASEPIKHDGEELFYVLKGSITAIIDGKHTVLDEGESIHFPSRLRHSTVNHTDKEACVLIICTMDIFGEAEVSGNCKSSSPRNDRTVSRKLQKD